MQPYLVCSWPVIYSLYRWVKAPSLLRLLTVGLACGLALAAKHSAILLLPMTDRSPRRRVGCPLCFAVGAHRRARPYCVACCLHALKLFGGLAAISVLAILVLWAFYGFRYAARPAGLHLDPDLATSVQGLKPFEAQGIHFFARISSSSGELSLRSRRRETDGQRNAHLYLRQGLWPWRLVLFSGGDGHQTNTGYDSDCLGSPPWLY